MILRDDETVEFHGVRMSREITAREKQILALAADGKNNAEIASVMHLSSHTIKTHLSKINVKLNARDRTHAVAIALRTGLIA